LKILVVSMGIDPASGGPTRSCKGLCRALAQAGVDVTLLVLVGKHEFENPCGVKVLYAEGAPLFTFTSRLHTYDIVHLQGLWHPGLHRIARACRKAGVPYVISPRGMLDPWALSVKKWKKRLAMFFYQRSDLKHAAAFHATAEMEAANIRAQGLRQPIFIVPNGVDAPKGLEQFRCQPQPPASTSEKRTALFLSRLHPGKGLLPLADAWARVKPKGWRMLVVGPDSYGHKVEVLSKLDALGISDLWVFKDMVDDVEKWRLYRSAELLVHPSVSENFGITIAEGLYAGLPVICTKGTPWKDVLEHHCGWWIGQGVENLAEALREATSTSIPGLSLLGQNGRALIERKYLWPAVARQMICGYKDVESSYKVIRAREFPVQRH